MRTKLKFSLLSCALAAVSLALPLSHASSTFSSSDLSQHFNQSAEFPNYFLPETYRDQPPEKVPPEVVAHVKSLIEQSLTSIFARVTVPLVLQGETSARLTRYFPYLITELRKIDPEVKIYASGGVDRSALTYLYDQIYEGEHRDPPVSAEETMKRIIADTEDLPGFRLRGIGSDFDVLITGKDLGTLQARAKAITDSAADTYGQEMSKGALKNSLFTLGDIRDYEAQTARSTKQGGSTIDYLAFDVTASRFKESKRFPHTADEFVLGLMTYAPPEGPNTLEDSADTAIRGARGRLELPWLKLKDDKELKKALKDVIAKVDGGSSLSERSIGEFPKMVRNARYFGAHNRFYRAQKNTVDDLVLQLANKLKERTSKNLLPEFADSLPLGRPLNGLPERLLMKVDQFIQRDTAQGILHHGTPSMENALAIMRQGLFLSKSNQGTAVYGRGAYTSPQISTSQGYAGGEGLIFKLKVKHDPKLRVLDWSSVHSDSWIQALVSRAQSARRDPFEVLAREHGIDIIVNTHVLVQNSQALEFPKGFEAIFDAYSHVFSDPHASYGAKLKAYQESMPLRNFANSIGEKFPDFSTREKELFVLQAIHSPKDDQRKLALKLLGELKGSPTVFKAYERALRDSNVNLTDIAIANLAKLPDREALDLLLRAADFAVNPTLQLQAIAALNRRSEPEAQIVYRKHLDVIKKHLILDPNVPLMRTRAIEALSGVSNPEVLALLQKAALGPYANLDWIAIFKGRSYTEVHQILAPIFSQLPKESKQAAIDQFLNTGVLKNEPDFEQMVHAAGEAALPAARWIKNLGPEVPWLEMAVAANQRDLTRLTWAAKALAGRHDLKSLELLRTLAHNPMIGKLIDDPPKDLPAGIFEGHSPQEIHALLAPDFKSLTPSVKVKFAQAYLINGLLRNEPDFVPLIQESAPYSLPALRWVKDFKTVETILKPFLAVANPFAIEGLIGHPGPEAQKLFLETYKNGVAQNRLSADNFNSFTAYIGALSLDEVHSIIRPLLESSERFIKARVIHDYLISGALKDQPDFLELVKLAGLDAAPATHWVKDTREIEPLIEEEIARGDARSLSVAAERLNGRHDPESLRLYEKILRNPKTPGYLVTVPKEYQWNPIEGRSLEDIHAVIHSVLSDPKTSESVRKLLCQEFLNTGVLKDYPDFDEIVKASGITSGTTALPSFKWVKNFDLIAPFIEAELKATGNPTRVKNAAFLLEGRHGTKAMELVQAAMLDSHIGTQGDSEESFYNLFVDRSPEEIHAIMGPVLKAGNARIKTKLIDDYLISGVIKDQPDFAELIKEAGSEALPALAWLKDLREHPAPQNAVNALKSITVLSKRDESEAEELFHKITKDFSKALRWHESVLSALDGASPAKVKNLIRYSVKEDLKPIKSALVSHYLNSGAFKNDLDLAELINLAGPEALPAGTYLNDITPIAPTIRAALNSDVPAEKQLALKALRGRHDPESLKLLEMATLDPSLPKEVKDGIWDAMDGRTHEELHSILRLLLPGPISPLKSQLIQQYLISGRMKEDPDFRNLIVLAGPEAYPAFRYVKDLTPVAQVLKTTLQRSDSHAQFLVGQALIGRHTPETMRLTQLALQTESVLKWNKENHWALLEDKTPEEIHAIIGPLLEKGDSELKSKLIFDYLNTGALKNFPDFAELIKKAGPAAFRAVRYVRNFYEVAPWIETQLDPNGSVPTRRSAAQTLRGRHSLEALKLVQKAMLDPALGSDNDFKWWDLFEGRSPGEISAIADPVMKSGSAAIKAKLAHDYLNTGAWKDRADFPEMIRNTGVSALPAVPWVKNYDEIAPWVEEQLKSTSDVSIRRTAVLSVRGHHSPGALRVLQQAMLDPAIGHDLDPPWWDIFEGRSSDEIHSVAGPVIKNGNTEMSSKLTADYLNTGLWKDKPDFPALVKDGGPQAIPAWRWISDFNHRVPAIENAQLNSNPLIRRLAARAIEGQHGPSVIPLLKKVLTDSEITRKDGFWGAFEGRTNDEIHSAISDVLPQVNPEVREHVVTHYLNSGAFQHYPDFVDLIRAAGYPAYPAMRFVSDFKRLDPIFADALDSKLSVFEVRKAAALALAGRHDDGVMRFVQKALLDPLLEEIGPDRLWHLLDGRTPEEIHSVIDQILTNGNERLQLELVHDYLLSGVLKNRSDFRAIIMKHVVTPHENDQIRAELVEAGFHYFKGVERAQFLEYLIDHDSHSTYDRALVEFKAISASEEADLRASGDQARFSDYAQALLTSPHAPVSVAAAERWLGGKPMPPGASNGLGLIHAVLAHRVPPRTSELAMGSLRRLAEAGNPEAIALAKGMINNPEYPHEIRRVLDKTPGVNATATKYCILERFQKAVGFR